jgi:predicted phage terminase large subunit-like protein
MKPSDVDILEQLAVAEARWSFYAYRQYINPKLKLGWWQRESAYELQRFYEDLIAGKRPRLIIEAPPQHGKSLLIVDFISWLAGTHPELRTIYTSFSERLGVRANLRLQRTYASDKFKKIFPDTKTGATVNRDLIEYEGTDGYFRNTTVRGSITGEGLDLGVIDDPIKGREQARSATVRDATWDWLTDDFMTRFADDAGLLIILTRWHIDDPVGRLKEIDPNIRCVSHPAIATEDEQFRKKGEPLFPEHKSLEFLLGIKKIMAASSWESLYQQRPFIEDGEFFKPDMIPIVDAIPAGIKQITRAWDLAATKDGGDWTVGFKFGKLPDGRGIILDIVRFQRGPDQVRLALKNTADLDGKQVKIRGPQDPGQAGKDQAQQLTMLLTGYKVEFKTVSGDKTIRAEGFASQANVGNVVMLRGSWNHALIEELRSFPNGVHDDQVDAGSDAFNDLMGSPDVLSMWEKLGK